MDWVHGTQETTGTSIRTIRGSVLTGKGVDNSRWAGFTTNAIHALPNTVETRIFGWTMPNLDEFSTSRTFLSGLFGTKKKFDIRPGVWGGVRAFLPLGRYQKVIATPDIAPDFLFRAMAVGDLEDSIRLGMLDLTMEEAALCTYVCPSKQEIDQLLRGMLNKLEQEA